MVEKASLTVYPNLVIKMVLRVILRISTMEILLSTLYPKNLTMEISHCWMLQLDWQSWTSPVHLTRLACSKCLYLHNVQNWSNEKSLTARVEKK